EEELEVELVMIVEMTYDYQTKSSEESQTLEAIIEAERAQIQSDRQMAREM
ncbi:hypothetical protein ACLOJK_027487, partial [Asimina triloba]